MSLDCYPLEKRGTISFREQPLALDVAYNDNLLIAVMDECRSAVVFDLEQVRKRESSEEHLGNLRVGEFSLGEDVVISLIVYCQRGDYLLCIGHKNEKLSIFGVFNWRNVKEHEFYEPTITELDLESAQDEAYKLEEYRDKLNHIDCCQRTGNIAVSCGETIFIYKYLECNRKQSFMGAKETRSEHSNNQNGFFSHIISLKLSIRTQKVCLLENYLAITSIDHVQVLKLDLLTLQIQSDALDLDLQEAAIETLQNQQHKRDQQQQKNGSDPSQFKGVTETRSDAANSTTTEATTLATTTTCSLISDSTSTTSNFSSFTTNNHDITLNGLINQSDVSILTLNNQHQHYPYALEALNDSSHSADDCITWNLNTKKLVKLPTLMHNTSISLSSYHICHPIELLGPASESIACRVQGSIYSQDLCQNQLETMVMLCRQFDFERDPIKSSHLKAVYLSSQEDLKRLSKSSQADHSDEQQQYQQQLAIQQQTHESQEASFLKSKDYELLASVTCFVSTLTSCFVYSLHNKKGVVRTQTITHPDLCLDFRPDLLNVYLLSPLGLQICTSGICDNTFRYDWSSSSDLNLNFIATNGISRILTTEKYVILVGSSPSTCESNCLIECLEKPNLWALSERIVYTVNRCNSIGIRSNMLTYLHASTQLSLLSYGARIVDVSINMQMLKNVTIMLAKQLLQKKQTNVITNNRIDKAIKHLLDISWCDLRELMNRHWQSLLMRKNNFGLETELVESSEFESSELDSSNELQQRKYGQYKLSKVEEHHSSVVFNSKVGLSTNGARFVGGKEISSMEDREDYEDERPPDTDYELIKIYLRYAKFSQSLLDYLMENLANEQFIARVIDYIFAHNPRLLIKCAQRFPLLGSKLSDESAKMLLRLVEKLQQLAELDSTGINRPTVLFTLAILYNALEERQKCLLAIDQIKPSNHLAITMSSNFEYSHSIAGLVKENYPDVYRLFLGQLGRKDKQAAVDYVARHGDIDVNKCGSAHRPEVDPRDVKLASWRLVNSSPFPAEKAKESLEQESAYSEGLASMASDGESEEDEQELLDFKFKLLTEIPTNEVIDLLLSKEAEQLDDGARRDFLEAFLKLMESQFILARLRDNSH